MKFFLSIGLMLVSSFAFADFNPLPPLEAILGKRNFEADCIEDWKFLKAALAESESDFSLMNQLRVRVQNETSAYILAHKAFQKEQNENAGMRSWFPHYHEKQANFLYDRDENLRKKLMADSNELENQITANKERRAAIGAATALRKEDCKGTRYETSSPENIATRDKAVDAVDKEMSRYFSIIENLTASTVELIQALNENKDNECVVVNAVYPSIRREVFQADEYVADGLYYLQLNLSGQNDKRNFLHIQDLRLRGEKAFEGINAGRKELENYLNTRCK